MDGGRNFFNVMIDGQRVKVLASELGLRDYLLEAFPEGDSARAGDVAQASRPLRVVELQKRTEANIATTCGSILGRGTRPVVIHGLLVEGGRDSVQQPLAQAAPLRRLEFLGNSETAGYGNLGPSEPGRWSLRMAFTTDPADQDSNLAWPALVAQALGAEFHVIAWSGVGVLWNCPGGCSADGNFLALYPRLLGSDPATSAASESELLLQGWQPDAIIVYIGGNDWYSLKEGKHDDLAQAFRRLLDLLQELRPAAKVVVLLATPTSFCSCIGDAQEQACFASDMERCWLKAVELADNPRVSLERVEPNPKIDVADSSDWGQCAHWSTQAHQKWARAAVPLVAKCTGWDLSGEASASQAGCP